MIDDFQILQGSIRTIEYDEQVARSWADILRFCAIELQAPNFAWHMAERGCAPASARGFAHTWLEDEFAPREFADLLEQFADQVQALLPDDAERGWPEV